MEIKNVPAEAWRYEFIVCTKEKDGYYYYSHHENVSHAMTDCDKINGIMVHNLRIQGYKE